MDEMYSVSIEIIGTSEMNFTSPAPTVYPELLHYSGQPHQSERFFLLNNPAHLLKMDNIGLII